MSALVLIPLLLTGMVTGAVFTSGSDVNEGRGRYTTQADNDSLGNLQPTNLPSPSPLATSSISPSTSQSPTGPSQSFGISPSSSYSPSETQLAADSHTVVFDPANGGEAERVTVLDGSLASPPADNPKRDGYRFDGWSEHDTMMDFRSPITRDITLKAEWTPVTDWVLSPDHGPASSATSITITPPSAGSPSFSTLEAHDGKLMGVTGDGRLFTLTTNDEMPAQVPSPQRESGDVRFTAGVVGDDSYAALSRDHRIYTWSKSGETPALHDADSTAYTSITMAADHLMAVDHEGRIHTWTSKGEPTGKAISLPSQALAVKAAGNADCMLALDGKGQIWFWKPDAINVNQIQPVKIANRIVQISALDHGFMLLYSTGQVSYLDNGQTHPEPLVLSDHSAITAISSDAAQTVLVDIRGRLWAWQPGSKPIRADDGSQQYLQAVKAGSRITAISRRGGIYRWGLDAQQSNPGKPAKVETATALTLESSSLDGKPLTLTKNNGSWKTDIPASKPGSTAITLVGRQDGQPFSMSLNYTVDQPLTQGVEPRSTLTVRFDTDGGSPEPADQHFPARYGRVKRPSPDPAREGFLFDGWFTGEVAYDFSRPVDKDLTLTAKWTPAGRNSTWSISPDKGSQLGNEATTITPPDTSRGIRFSQISGGTDYNDGFSLAVASDGNAYAWGSNQYGQLGDGTITRRTTPVRVSKPVGAPTDFTFVQVSAGYWHSLAIGNDGNVYAWGDNRYGQLGNGTTGGYQTKPVRVQTPDRKTYPDLPADFTYVQVSGGGNNSLAVGSDGNAYAWGLNQYGQLGNGTTTNRNTPVRVSNPADTPTDFTFVQVSGGAYYSLAVGNDDNVYAWGINQYGQLGNNTSNTFANPIPVRVRDPANPTDASKGLKAVQVNAGWRHSLAVGKDGYAYAWGYNDDGQLGNNTSNTFANPIPVRVRDPANPTDASKGLKAVQVSGGYEHSLALGSDGYAYAWGRNYEGQLGNTASGSTVNPIPVRVRDPANPTDTSQGLKAVQVSTGFQHSLAVDSDGYTYAWGNNQYGELGNDSISTGDYSPVPVPAVFNLMPVITGIRFDSTRASGLTRGAGNSVTVLTPAHQPGTVTVSVDYTLGGAPKQPDTSLRYTYLPVGTTVVIPRAGGEGILLALATGITGMGGVLASRRHQKETQQLLHAWHE
ncbi:InlB B-repeat-containing protein [Bifidobacterium sp. W8109]|uniref:RCC1 domain-containing protein n=1 Tax=Bifidobacterium TaxID=1678 RepID=UPI0018DCD183|nr:MULTISPECIES: InlB B-repeat-containing protein [Bifidobacterium]MBH9971923.1 InlB B-repeat-containing protein [Bifidobacterium asteroides]MBI0073569.1 InlB B-repeat-containing protein [Bifidobacterium sp. W8110]